jgi:hypothetical protein
VADYGNHVISRVKMTGVVITVVDNGEKGFTNRTGAPALFNGPCHLVVDGEGIIVVALQSTLHTGT